jgi:hypothetical protein
MYESEDGQEHVEKAVREGIRQRPMPKNVHAAMHALARRESQPRVLHADCHFVALTKVSIRRPCKYVHILPL